MPGDPQHQKARRKGSYINECARHEEEEEKEVTSMSAQGMKTKKKKIVIV